METKKASRERRKRMKKELWDFIEFMYSQALSNKHK